MNHKPGIGEIGVLVLQQVVMCQHYFQPSRLGLPQYNIHIILLLINQLEQEEDLIVICVHSLLTLSEKQKTNHHLCWLGAIVEETVTTIAMMKMI